MDPGELRRGLRALLLFASLGAMAYVGLYQLRAIEQLACPVYGNGCATVADSRASHPFGMPGAWLAVALYVVMVLLNAIPSDWQRWPQWALFALSIGNLALNALAYADMQALGTLSFWSFVTAALSVPIAALSWPTPPESAG